MVFDKYPLITCRGCPNKQSWCCPILEFFVYLRYLDSVVASPGKDETWDVTIGASGDQA
jgi:hypothetical protein